MSLRSWLLVALVTLSVPLAVQAQPNQPSAAPTGSAVLQLPVATGVLGQYDPAAMTELLAHVAAIGAASEWKGFQASGTLTNASGTSGQAILTASDGIFFRLDVQTPRGNESIRISRFLGKIQEPTGKLLPLDPQTAAVGLFPFGVLRAAHFPRKNTSFHDHGLVSIGSVQLHRISYEFPTIGWNPSTKSRQTGVIDFYFDPTTHLLAKSASQVYMPTGRRIPLTSVVSYSDYRRVDGSLIPFDYTETLEGQPFRTLQLTTVNLNPTLTPSDFQF